MSDEQDQKRPPGRPTKLTAELITAIARELAGDDQPTRRIVCAELGLDEGLFSKWMTRGEEKLAARKSGSLQAQLVIEVRRAEAKAQRSVHKFMIAAGYDKTLNPTPRKWLAAARWPAEYRDKPLKEQVDAGPEWAREIDLAATIDDLEAKLEAFLGPQAPPAPPPAPDVPASG